MDHPVKPGGHDVSGPRFSPTVIARLDRAIHLLSSSCHEGICLHSRVPEERHALYGVTSHPSRRWFEHQHELTPGFTSKYGVKRLVWIEQHDLVVAAIKREKAIKKWPRKWKVELIATANPEWEDVSHWLLDR